MQWNNDEEYMLTKNNKQIQLGHLGSKETTIPHKLKMEGLCEDNKPALWCIQQLQARKTAYWGLSHSDAWESSKSAIQKINIIENEIENFRNRNRNRDLWNLGEFDGGGSGDDGVAEEFGNEREQAILVREVAMAKRLHGAAHINP